jgi:hypothetical protein
MKNYVCIIFTLLICQASVVLANGNDPYARLVYDIYHNSSTITFETELYPTFKGPQPYYDIGFGFISESSYWCFDVNWLMRVFSHLVIAEEEEIMADDDIHDVQFGRIFRYRGGYPVFDTGAGTVDIAFNVLDWYVIEADKGFQDEYRAAGVGFGLGLGHHWMMNEHFCSQLSICYNMGFNADAKELAGSSVADRYITAEADVWYFFNDVIGLTAKAHYETHDFEQLVIKSYPTAGGGTVDVFSIQLGATLAITWR